MEQHNSPVAVGDVLADKYRVERVLGVGGMGVVVAARHVELGELRAVKLMRREMAQHERGVQRFLREAKAAVRLKSERIARVYDVGRLPGGEPYLVMEYLEGFDLKKMVKLSGLPPSDRAVDLLMQALEAMAEAHEAGVIHRDIKPANLFVTEGADGEASIKVLDFGISKLSDGTESDGDMTKTNAALGSPYYMSPEQMKSTKDVDRRTDLWSLGVVLYELLSGKRPFQGDSMTAYLLAAATEAPAALPTDVPPGLAEVVQRCLEKDRQRRYPDVLALATALCPFGSDDAHRSLERIQWIASGANRSGSGPSLSFRRSHSSMPAADLDGATLMSASFEVVDTGEAAAGEASSTTLAMQRDAPPPPKRRVPLGLLAGAAGCVVAGGFAVWFFTRPAEPPRAAASPAASAGSSAVPTPPMASAPPTSAAPVGSTTTAVAAPKASASAAETAPTAAASSPPRSGPPIATVPETRGKPSTRPAAPPPAPVPKASAAPPTKAEDKPSTPKQPKPKPADPFGMERL